MSMRRRRGRERLPDPAAPQRSVTHWIAGRPWSGQGGRLGVLYDPASGQQAGIVRFATPHATAAAVAAAAAALPGWWELPTARRVRHLFALRDALATHAAELTALISAEQGKPISAARDEVDWAIEAAGLASTVTWAPRLERAELVAGDARATWSTRPAGVVVALTPATHPLLAPLRMAATALAYGNTIVLKPSELAPSASARLAELSGEAGLPPGVVNVLHGGRAAARALLASPDVAAVSVAGAGAAGRLVAEAAVRHGQRVQALCGGRHHLVALPDANLDAVADATVRSAFMPGNDLGVAGPAVLAVGEAGDPLVARILARMARLRVGPPADPGSDIGPLTTGALRDQAQAYLEAAVKEGAALAADGRQHEITGNPAGFWLGPSLIDQVSPGMTAYREASPGPVVLVLRPADFDEALRLVQAAPVGSPASLYTADPGLARRFEVSCRAPVIGVNALATLAGTIPYAAAIPAGSVGRDSPIGLDGMGLFTRHTVFVRPADDTAPPPA